VEILGFNRVELIVREDQIWSNELVLMSSGVAAVRHGGASWVRSGTVPLAGRSVGPEPSALLTSR